MRWKGRMTISSLQTAQKAQKTAGALDQKLTAAQTELGKQQTVLAKLEKTVGGWKDELKALSADPKKNAAQIADLKSKIEASAGGFKVQTGRVEAAAMQVTTARAALYDAEKGALVAAKLANTEALMEGKAVPFEQAVRVDSVEDAASMSRADQQRILGAAAPIDPKVALNLDMNKLMLAANAGNGPAMLEDILRSSDPANHATLLKLIPSLLPVIVSQTKTEKTAEAMTRALKAASPEARALLNGPLAAELSGKFKPDNALRIALTENMGTAQGIPVDTAVALQEGLEKTGDVLGAEIMGSMVAQQIGGLRKDFEKKFDQTNGLKLELARLQGGFGPMLTDAQKKKATDSFMKLHAKDFAETEAAAAALSTALPALQSLNLSSRSSGEGSLLRKEATKVLGDLEKLSETNKGGDALLKAVEGKEPWLMNALDFTKTNKDLAEGMAKVVTSSIALKALRGGAVAKDAAIETLGRLEHVLGAKGLKEIQTAFGGLDGSPESMKKAKDAFQKIDAGEFGKTPIQKNLFKVFGLALSIPSVAQGLSGLGDAGTADRVKTLMDSAKLSTDAAELMLKNVAKESVLSGLSKVGTAAGIVSGVIDGVKGVAAIADGHVGEGAADLMTGAGGVMMGLAQLGVAIPGGQLIGAALAVGGLVVKLVTGNKEAREKEEGMEEGAAEFLKGAGIPDAAATALGDIRRKDQANMGQVMVQLAEEFNMDPKALLAFLIKHPDKLDDFADKAFDLSDGPDGKFLRKGRYVPSNGDQGSRTYVGMDDLVAWMKDNGLDPKKD